MRQIVEVTVAGEKSEIVLQDKRRDPHVVGGNGRTLRPQLAVDECVLLGGLIVCVEDSNTGLQKELAQNALVARTLLSNRKTCT